MTQTKRPAARHITKTPSYTGPKRCVQQASAQGHVKYAESIRGHARGANVLFG